MSGYSNSDRFILEPDKLSRPVSSESDLPASRGKTPPIGLPKRKVPLQRSALAPPESLPPQVDSVRWGAHSPDNESKAIDKLVVAKPNKTDS